MSKHRHPQDSVANNAHVDNFNPADALESLYAEMISVEAFAHAASEAFVQLRCPSSRAERRTFARIYTLVTRAAAEASTALARGDALVAALSAYMEAHRARRELDPPT
jgi:hypothetical protein